VSGTTRARVKRTVFQFKRLSGDKEKVPQNDPQIGLSPTKDTVGEASTSMSAAAAAAAGGDCSGRGAGTDDATAANAEDAG
jgi:hypothetical protein